MKFIDQLINVVEATSSQKKLEQWDVQGILKGKYNQLYKFDTRPLQKTKEGETGKYSAINTKADKMVFEEKEKWIILDVNELHQYLKRNNLQKINLEDLLSKLEWNIILPK